MHTLVFAACELPPRANPHQSSGIFNVSMYTEGEGIASHVKTMTKSKKIPPDLAVNGWLLTFALGAESIRMIDETEGM